MDVTSVATQVSDLATSGAANAWLLAGNFVILLVLFIVMLLFSYKAGRGGIISLIVAFYAGYAIYMVFPYTQMVVNAGGTPLVKAVISVAVFAIATFIPFHFVQRLASGGFGVLSVVPRFVLSFLAAAFLLALAYHVFDISDIYTFPAPIDKLFAPEGYFFWWFIAPMAGLLFLVH
ncbi:MAG TPA: hypothetical protein VEA36_00130 [Candidatus Paceibacterota bacterium]|nr:hypothetical protein [Candidatus Paceibacterota bacterium]